MNRCSLVVGSKYRDFFDQCRPGFDRLTGVERRFVVVDDPENWTIPGWTAVQSPMPYRGMAATLNAGLRAAEPDDVLWIQDDVIVHDADLMERLRHVAYFTLHAHVGAVAPTVKGEVGNSLQNADSRERTTPVVSDERLCFMCVYFTRHALDVTGLMDERFTGYTKDVGFWPHSPNAIKLQEPTQQQIQEVIDREGL